MVILNKQFCIMGLFIRSRLVFFCILLFSFSAGHSQQAPAISLEQQLRSFHDISGLPGYRANTVVAQVSTYDTTGGNNDGFNGNYSFIRKLSDSNLVIFDVKGPGSINRMWTPTPSNDTLDFYIDDNGRPAFRSIIWTCFQIRSILLSSRFAGTSLGDFTATFPFLFKAAAGSYAAPKKQSSTSCNTAYTQRGRQCGYFPCC